MIRIGKPLVIQISSDGLMAMSLYMFILLYNLPITILVPDPIRKSLLIIGLLLFIIGVSIKNIKYILLFVVGVAVEVVFYIMSWSAQLSFGSYIFPAFISMEFLICAFMIIDGRVNIPKGLITLFIIVTFITALTTILGLLQYPTAIRTLARVSDDYNAYWQNLYRTKNIAGWGLLFSMAFSGGTFLYLYKKQKNLIFLVVLAVDIVCVLMSQLMFAILMMGLIIFFVFINGKSRYVIHRTIPFLILFILFWIERERILLWLYSLFEDTDLKVLSLRIKNLYDLLVLKDSAGDAGTRFELYAMSLESFINHPFGRFFVGTGNVLNEIGFHSEFCDLIGTLGVFGLGFILYLFYEIKKRISRISNIFDRRFYISMVSIFGIMFLINPIIPYPQVWMSTLLIPLIAIGEVHSRTVTPSEEL